MELSSFADKLFAKGWVDKGLLHDFLLYIDFSFLFLTLVFAISFLSFNLFLNQESAFRYGVVMIN